MPFYLAFFLQFDVKNVLKFCQIYHLFYFYDQTISPFYRTLHPFGNFLYRCFVIGIDGHHDTGHAAGHHHTPLLPALRANSKLNSIGSK